MAERHLRIRMTFNQSETKLLVNSSKSPQIYKTCKHNIKLILPEYDRKCKSNKQQKKKPISTLLNS